MGKSKSFDFSIMLVFWSLVSLVRNSVVLAVYLLFSVACFFTVHEHSGRELNEKYKEKLVGKALFRYSGMLFVPYPVRAGIAAVRSLRYIGLGFKTLCSGKLEVPVLDATAIGVSTLRGDMKMAGFIMFLLGIGGLLEEWTHKKSVGDLARSMSLNISKVWLHRNGQEIMTSVLDIKIGDEIVVRMGNVVPFDGVVLSGEGMVNQASLTGESAAVFKQALAEADTIVFDKTGTLTEAKPVVADVLPFLGGEPDELLRTAACLEEHFPHSMARAVVEAAGQKGLEHSEMHSRVEYIVAHGISSRIGGQKVIIGSYHFVFQDEQCTIPEGMQERFDALSAE